MTIINNRPPREVGMSFDHSSLMGMQAGIKTQTRRKPDTAKRVRPGDTLWVKEGYFYAPKQWYSYEHRAHPEDKQIALFYTRDLSREDASDLVCKRMGGRYMPKWASRYRLDVLEVRVERLHDISEEDCVREGIYNIYGSNIVGPRLWLWHGVPRNKGYDSPREAYRARWDGLNKAAPWRWEDNPEVDVITFGPLIHG
jgi:ribosomal protein L20A (L18A)